MLKKKIIKFSTEKRKIKSFNKDFFILIWIIICFFVTAFLFVWIGIEFQIANIKSSGIIIDFNENTDTRILSSETLESPLVAVIIDNHIDSRPSIGLADSIFVWEAPVEAGITRFMAIYPTKQDVEMIGPVRSLRPYFIDWAAELGAVLVHCGGSPEALDLVKTVYTRGINQFFNDDYFWRTWKRYAPHNLLTSTENLREAMKEKDFEKLDFESWKFKDDTDFLERPKKQEVLIESWLKEHKIRWNYNFLKNDYERTQGNSVHKDSAGNEIRAKNIIIQFTEVEIIDAIGRREIKTIGEGRASVFMDGQRISAFWKKSSREARTKFYDEHGEELLFNKGTTWIEVVPAEMMAND